MMNIPVTTKRTGVKTIKSAVISKEIKDEF